MKVQTEVKSGAFLDTAANQVGAVANQAGQFLAQANNQANSVVGYVGAQASNLWNTISSALF
jgi:hypothetical protein